MAKFLSPVINLQQPLQKEQDSDQQMEMDVIDKKIIVKLRNPSSHTLDTKVVNHKGESLGRIKKITYDDENKIQYIILHCTSFFRGGNRYFAVPASSDLLELSEEGKVVIKLDKNDLKLAKGISADKCPPPSLKFGPSTYELYNYRDTPVENSGPQKPISRK